MWNSSNQTHGWLSWNRNVTLQWLPGGVSINWDTLPWKLSLSAGKPCPVKSEVNDLRSSGLCKGVVWSCVVQCHGLGLLSTWIVKYTLVWWRNWSCNLNKIWLISVFKNRGETQCKIKLLKMNNSMAFSIFTMLCNKRPRYLLSNYPHSPLPQAPGNH